MCFVDVELRQQRLHYIVTWPDLMQRWVLFWVFFPWVELVIVIVHKHMECHPWKLTWIPTKRLGTCDSGFRYGSYGGLSELFLIVFFPCLR